MGSCHVVHEIVIHAQDLVGSEKRDTLVQYRTWRSGDIKSQHSQPGACDAMLLRESLFQHTPCQCRASHSRGMGRPGVEPQYCVCQNRISHRKPAGPDLAQHSASSDAADGIVAVPDHRIHVPPSDPNPPRSSGFPGGGRWAMSHRRSLLGNGTGVPGCRMLQKNVRERGI
eukprot:3066607-Rhodomonas_salina.1